MKGKSILKCPPHIITFIQYKINKNKHDKTIQEYMYFNGVPH